MNQFVLISLRLHVDPFQFETGLKISKKKMVNKKHHSINNIGPKEKSMFNKMAQMSKSLLNHQDSQRDRKYKQPFPVSSASPPSLSPAAKMSVSSSSTLSSTPISSSSSLSKSKRKERKGTRKDFRKMKISKKGKLNGSDKDKTREVTHHRKNPKTSQSFKMVKKSLTANRIGSCNESKQSVTSINDHLEQDQIESFNTSRSVSPKMIRLLFKEDNDPIKVRPDDGSQANKKTIEQLETNTLVANKAIRAAVGQATANKEKMFEIDSVKRIGEEALLNPTRNSVATQTSVPDRNESNTSNTTISNIFLAIDLRLIAIFVVLFGIILVMIRKLASNF